MKLEDAIAESERLRTQVIRFGRFIQEIKQEGVPVRLSRSAFYVKDGFEVSIPAECVVAALTAERDARLLKLAKLDTVIASAEAALEILLENDK